MIHLKLNLIIPTNKIIKLTNEEKKKYKKTIKIEHVLDS